MAGFRHGTLPPARLLFLASKGVDAPRFAGKALEILLAEGSLKRPIGLIVGVHDPAIEDWREWCASRSVRLVAVPAAEVVQTAGPWRRRTGDLGDQVSMSSHVLAVWDGRPGAISWALRHAFGAGRIVLAWKKSGEVWPRRELALRCGASYRSEEEAS